MALMKCPECSNDISDQAESCPQCGFPIVKYLEKMKVERLEQESIAADKLKEEEQKQKQLNDNTLNHTGDDYSHELYSAYKTKPNYKLMMVIAGAILLSVVYIINSSSNDANTREQLEITQKRTLFNSTKELIKSNKLQDVELYKTKDSLASIDASMPEYKEAQVLLPIVTKRILVVEKDKEVKAAKERKLAEDAQYTPGGKRVHARHPNWSPDECNAIAKGSIHIGMNEEQVAAAWGRPYHVNTSVGSYGTHKQWVMYEMGSTYVYFEDGICTSMQGVK